MALTLEEKKINALAQGVVNTAETLFRSLSPSIAHAVAATLSLSARFGIESQAPGTDIKDLWLMDCAKCWDDQLEKFAAQRVQHDAMAEQLKAAMGSALPEGATVSVAQLVADPTAGETTPAEVVAQPDGSLAVESVQPVDPLAGPAPQA